MSPEERLLRTHLRSGQFVLGEAEGRWRCRELCWPDLVVSITAKDGREFTLNLNCDQYPQQAPTGHLWDMETRAPLPKAQWPKSKGGSGVVSTAFRKDGWNGVGKGLYLPIDRAPLEDHPDWRAHPMAWRPDEGICQYLEAVYEVLHCPDYDS